MQQSTNAPMLGTASKPTVGGVGQIVVCDVPPMPSRRRILLAEDDEAIALILARALGKAGFDVSLAADGQAALDLFMTAESGFDLLLLDVMMPRLDGIAALNAIRRCCPEIPCVVMTAWTSMWPETKLTDAGADCVLAKPFDLALLLATVASFSSKHWNR